MIKMIIVRLSILCIGLMSGLVQATEHLLYTANKGEILSDVLYSYNLKPIYGPNGSLAKALALNPELVSNKGNRIYPGQKIILPIKESPKVVEAKIPVTEAPEPQKRHPSEDVTDDARASISVSLGLDFMRVDQVDIATKKSSVILSEAMPTIGIGYNLLWDQNTAFSLSGRLQRFALQDLNNGQTFDKNNGYRFDLGLKITRQVTEKLFLGAGLAFEQDLFFHGISETELGVDKVLITKPTSHIRYILSAKRNANFGLDGKLGANLSNRASNYSIKNGFNVGIGPYFKYHSKLQDKNYKSLEAKIFYSIDQQDSSITERKVSNLSILVSYDWQFDW